MYVCMYVCMVFLGRVFSETQESTLSLALNKRKVVLSSHRHCRSFTSLQQSQQENVLYKWVRLADIEHCFFQNACMRMYEGSSILTNTVSVSILELHIGQLRQVWSGRQIPRLLLCEERKSSRACNDCLKLLIFQLSQLYCCFF